MITTDSRAEILAFARARLTDAPSDAAAGTLRQVLGLYESATEMMGLLSPRDSHRPRFEIAAEAYLNVIKLYAAGHRDHPDYRPDWHDDQHDDHLDDQRRGDEHHDDRHLDDRHLDQRFDRHVDWAEREATAEPLLP